jgi:hypothetical protein
LAVRDVFYSQVFSGYSKYQNIDVTIRQSKETAAWLTLVSLTVLPKEKQLRNVKEAGQEMSRTVLIQAAETNRCKKCDRGNEQSN